MRFALCSALHAHGSAAAWCRWRRPDGERQGESEAPQRGAWGIDGPRCLARGSAGLLPFGRPLEAAPIASLWQRDDRPAHELLSGGPLPGQ